ncbi:putative ABC transport system ATP-binding protein [Pseudonocardia sediminis]|uniref:Putative ABC transport system ATP-binding protein n=1 Tax=Pseudonocardia sediminis TaxID=1397368 RepID=A0A4Q7UTR4_PSEST|nr:ABC transporter ATP-binding protein [Pseudonocardia sediminis]RZT85096.1 putative ABC transport system ATP-binding protein [Pseudonocardia sediminis]
MARDRPGRRVLRGSVAAQRGTVSAAAVLFCGHQAGEALVPVLVGVVIDEAVTTGDPVALALWLGVLGLDFLMLSFSYRWGARRAWLADIRADQRLRMMLTVRVLDPRGGAEAGRPPGELVAIATADAKRVGVVNFVLPLGIASLAALGVAAVSLLVISVPLGLLILLGTPPLLYLVGLLGRPLESRSEREQERAAEASGVAADLVAGVRVLTGLGAGPAAVARYCATSRGALAATLRATRAQAGYSGAVLAANGLFLALVALVGGRLALDGAITVGGLVAAVGLAQFLVEPMETLGWVNAKLAQARASAGRIAAVLAAEPAVGDGGRPVPAVVPGALTVRGLTHGPLHGVDLDVAAGEHVGVLATDPGDAVALLACLGREADPEHGTVELDGTALGEHPPRAARAAVLVCAHDAVLFAGTFDDNVRAAAAPGADPAPALAAAAADQVAAALPEGGHTAVAEQGASLSGGQRQRVALARALAAGPPVLVLHDPTTALDPVTEALVADGVRALRDGRTTVVVTSSPALLARTDRVVVLSGGRVTVSGRHDELMGREDYRTAVTT